MRELMSWHTAAALLWLEVVLKERFGQRFWLRVGDGSALVISRQSEPGEITLALDGATFVRSDSDLPCTKWSGSAEGWSTALHGELPAPGVCSLDLPLIRATGHGYHIGYDVLGFVYWMLTRKEEIGRCDLDNHGRFPATASHAYRQGYLERPIVDEWLHVLGQVIRKVWPGLKLSKHAFSVKLSHDVDTPSLYGFKPWSMIGRMMAGDLLKRRDVRACIAAPLVKLGTREALHAADPFNTFDWIMDQSEAHNLRSAFYFICGRTDARRDADYDPEHPAIRQLMRRIHARGHEIGLHPSYGSYRNPQVILDEVSRLRGIAREEGIVQAQWGGRMHYLRWQQPVTLRGWADAGMDYDSTLGYADRPGFRCGTCFEYPAFDPVAGQILPLRIRPLIAMECTIISSMYLGLGLGERAQKKFDELKSACAMVDGCFTLLWHNSSFHERAQRELYCNVARMDVSNRVSM
ncbi:polysaccharide deacetylase family protein [Pseudomonas mosselii]|uniref:polysaccharide deacetylase family protein n=1 Tax=Pseudomonas mosselii TaxID=78327 RepID=UPI000AB1FE4D|nr:polysaccharide deacetylase family protein [Pseudomonas mosselii]